MTASWPSSPTKAASVMPTRTLTLPELDRIDPPQAAPQRQGLIGELGTLVEPLRLAGKSIELARAPRGDGRTAIAIPGWRAPEASTLPIRAFLRRLGHDARSWGLGTNIGDVEALRDRFVERVEAIADTTGRPVNLVGWSLGGVIAREAARTVPDAVNRVVTYGSPAVGGPSFTVGASSYGAEECARISELQQQVDADDPIRTPITAMFTRNDNIVDWRACIDRTSPNVTHVEVASTHVGLGIDPDVWMTAARVLAED